MNARRELAAFFASPALALALLWLPLLAVDWATWLWVSLASVPFGWGVFAFFGLPLHIVAIRRGWTKLWQYLAGGVVIGLGGIALLWPTALFVGLVLTELLPDPNAGFPSEAIAQMTVIAAVISVGVVSSGFFWQFAQIEQRASERHT